MNHNARKLLTLLIGWVAARGNREKDFSVHKTGLRSKLSSLIGKLIAVLNMTLNPTALNIAEMHLKINLIGPDYLSCYFRFRLLMAWVAFCRPRCANDAEL